MNKVLYHIFIVTTTFMVLLILGCSKAEQKTIVTIDVNYSVANNNYTAPVKVSFVNNTKGASSYSWTFDGGSPATSNLKNPGIVTFNTGGAHKVVLEAWNNDERKTKEIILQLDSAVVIDFDTSFIDNKYAPLTVHIANKTIGATSFNWTFDGGNPATSSLQNPPDIIFATPGNHNIRLKASNGRDTFSLSKSITVEPALAASFNINPSFEDIDDMEAPLIATLDNTTISGTNWQWSCNGATFSNANAKSPTVYIANPGTYTIQLVADNVKSHQTVTKTITVLPNSNLRTHSNIKFYVSQSAANYPKFYSTRFRKSYSYADNLDTVGKWIDISFFGLNQLFGYNKFISPDSLSGYGFAPLNQAQQTIFINSQELCNCGVNFTTAMFDNMVDDTPLQTININGTIGGWKQFDNTALPRLVLFKTQDGRKGVIKLKQFVNTGINSYIVADIKIQKNY